MAMARRWGAGLAVSAMLAAACSAAAADRSPLSEAARGLDRAAAHARMPDTMYASTPSPEPPPHANVRRVLTAPSAGPSAPSLAEAAAHAVPLLAPASDTRRLGVARIANHGDTAGDVRIAAFDDAGARYGPLTLRIGAGETVHLDSRDIELGNPDKGLSGSTGSGSGPWRLEVTSALRLEVLSYARTPDGFLASMHDTVARTEAGRAVSTFHPADDASRTSRLRVVNPGPEPAAVRVSGVDDAGRSPGSAVTFTVPARGARTVTAGDLETGSGVTGALGDGEGRWRLLVTSEAPVLAMSLLSVPSGHVSNLSTAPRAGAAHSVPLLPSASRFERDGVRGIVRVVNRGPSTGEASIVAYDDTGRRFGPVALTLGARQAVHFDSADLEAGNAAKGLATGIGAGTGDWRLELESGLDIEVLAYAGTGDGFLAPLHDTAPGAEAGRAVSTLVPGSDEGQVGRLRVINPGATRAAVRIEGVDDAGRSPGSAVTLTVPARGARTVTAGELEAGTGVAGALGDGAGRWRLLVRSDRPVRAMSLLSGAEGRLANLSTAPGVAVRPGETAASVFAAHVSGPVVQAKCVGCHVSGGAAGETQTRLVFARSSEAGHEAHNLAAFEALVGAVEEGAAYVLNKVQGALGHGGGAQVPAGSADFAHMERFLALLGTDVSRPRVAVATLFDPVRLAPARKTLRRAALVFAGRVPTAAEYAAAERDEASLRRTVRGLMTGPGFHEFLTRGANDRLLTDRRGHILDEGYGLLPGYTNEAYRRRKASEMQGDDDFYYWKDRVQHGVRRAPVELIAYVAENDRPYTEVLTADYIMANPWSAKAYGASTRFDDPEDMFEFQPSRIEDYHRRGDGYEDEYDQTFGLRVLDPGPLRTEYPHAGVLNTNSFLFRYPSTATNRNRARSRWTYYHFLGVDIEKSASRTTDPAALADTNNPTLRNPACTVCHTLLDPVAGAFQNYGDEGYYKDKWGGVDSLDDFYKQDGGEVEVFEIQAASWADRQTFSMTAWLDHDSRLILRHLNNNWCDADECGTYGRDFRLDELTVRDAGNGALVHRVEWEVLDEHCEYDGRYNEGTGEDDHYQWWGWDCVDIPLGLPDAATYVIEVVAWADRAGDELAKLEIGARLYREGDVWYRDMRAPGFAGEEAPDTDNSVQWLARKIVADERFAAATVRFWWPAIMGSEVAEPPGDEGDADFEGRLLAANAQGAEVERLAAGFRGGFHGGRRYNLKDLLTEIVLSKWFRADALEGSDPVRAVALRDAGARRLLTPEELARKTLALTGYQWGRHIRDGCWPRCDPRPNDLTSIYRLFYGGIDSDGIIKRARDMTSTMAGVAKRHAVRTSCAVVAREIYLLPDAERRLFSGIDPFMQYEYGIEFGATFEIEAEHRDGEDYRTSWETVSLSGQLAAGARTARLAFLNEFWEPEPPHRGRHVRLDRLDVRDAAGRIVASHELENLEAPRDCNHSVGDHFALHCAGWVDVPIEVPAAGRYTIEIVARADHAGDELPRLRVDVLGPARAAREYEEAIRSKLVELHETLLGVVVAPHSPDIDAGYRLFVEAAARRRDMGERWFNHWDCAWQDDLFFFEGILDDVVTERVDENGYLYVGLDWDRIHPVLDGVDWSDPEASAQAWVVVLAYLLMDYRYLYL